MRPERSFDRKAVALLRPGPPLRRSEDDGGPSGTRRGVTRASGRLEAADRLDTGVERPGEILMDAQGVVALDEENLVAFAFEAPANVRVGGSSEDGRPGDLVTVEMEDGEHRSVASGVQEPNALPRRRERAGLRLAVAHDRRHDEARVVERRAESVSQDVAELSAFMDGAGGWDADVARNASGRREAAEEAAEAGDVARDLGIDLGVGPLEIDVRKERRAAVAGTREEDHVQLFLHDQAVQVDVEEVQARRRAPVSEEARLDVVPRERLPKKGIVLQVDLTDGEVVRGPKVGVQRAKLLRRERALRGAFRSLLRAGSLRDRARDAHVEVVHASLLPIPRRMR